MLTNDIISFEQLGLVVYLKQVNNNFLYNLYIFVWIQHICIANRDFAVDPSSSGIKRL